MKLPWTAVWLVAMVSTVAVADNFEYYADFRYMSGLPGGGYGVSQEPAWKSGVAGRCLETESTGTTTHIQLPVPPGNVRVRHPVEHH